MYDFSMDNKQSYLIPTLHGQLIDCTDLNGDVSIAGVTAGVSDEDHDDSSQSRQRSSKVEPGVIVT